MTKAMITGVLCACLTVVTIEYLDKSNVEKELLQLKIQEKKLSIQALKLELTE